MSHASVEWNLAARDALRERVRQVLSSDARLDRVELQGSLASGKADVYSDIDIFAHLRPGLTDREYFLQLPQMMDAVGPRLIDGLSFAAHPNYAGTFYFDGIPLFWHVDVGCIPAGPEWHVDGGDLFAMTRWEQRFKMWIEAVKRLLRAEADTANARASVAFDDYVADMKRRITKRVDVSSVAGDPRHQLSTLIDIEIAWHREHGMGTERVFEACEALRRDILVRTS